MRMIGTTISLAGNPRINAMRMIPSSPMSRPAGSRTLAQAVRSEPPPTGTLAMSQITSPAGAATATARARTNSVRSQMERTMTFPTCGRR